MNKRRKKVFYLVLTSFILSVVLLIFIQELGAFLFVMFHLYLLTLLSSLK